MDDQLERMARAFCAGSPDPWMDGRVPGDEGSRAIVLHRMKLLRSGRREDECDQDRAALAAMAEQAPDKESKCP
jgi:hypothetical protein